MPPSCTWSPRAGRNQKYHSGKLKISGQLVEIRQQDLRIPDWKKLDAFFNWWHVRLPGFRGKRPGKLAARRGAGFRLEIGRPVASDAQGDPETFIASPLHRQPPLRQDYLGGGSCVNSRPTFNPFASYVCTLDRLCGRCVRCGYCKTMAVKTSPSA
jgi:hypothetical protein